MSTDLAIGEILEISCDDTVAYASYAGKHSWLGDAFWLIPRLFESPQSAWPQLFSTDGYFVFYPVHTGLKHKHIRKVGFALEAMRPVPALVRTAVSKTHDGTVTSWLITDGITRMPRLDNELNADERLLPIGAIWNYKLLCDRLKEGWKPVR